MAGSPGEVTAAAVAGLLVGLVLNVGLTRRTDSEDPVCPRCGSDVSFIGNVPFLSWFRVTLRCSKCDWRETTWLDWRAWIGEVLALHDPRQARWSPSFLFVGAGVAAIFGASVAAWGATILAWHAAVLGTLLLAIAISDAAIRIIPGEYTIAGIVAGIALAFAGGPITPRGAILGSLVGAATIWSVGVFGTWVFKKEAMGGGDIDLMAMVGAFLGVKAVFLTVMLGALAGTLIYAPLMFINRDLGQRIPFGVYLALGAVVTLLAGDALVAAYLRLVLGP